TAPAGARCSSQASVYGTRPTCMTYPPLAAVAFPALEALAKLLEEAAGVRAVDEAVVVRKRDVHQRPDRDDVLAHRVLHDPRPLHERIRAEDGGLRLADHGRAVERAVAAGVRDRERPALDLVRHE